MYNPKFKATNSIFLMEKFSYFQNNSFLENAHLKTNVNAEQ